MRQCYEKPDIKTILQKEKKISLFEIDGKELQNMFHEFDKAMEHKRNDPAITHPQLRLVRKV